ncbi:hypothetical protein HPB50_010005 [Hyalomma asiaticum]|uniref:Uncharacterized protein n=1 Tax=Hyalomma asiaticum TaxID=266040 RepID=A0ACB7SWW7_HYAAI|nr:hypothetical protein HPB50_010005 [Hyalomma asiaticum]
MTGWLRTSSDKLTKEEPTPQYLQRVQGDLEELHAGPPPGSLFHWLLECRNDYPMRLPTMFFFTGAGEVASFKSHIRKGNICLSTLGTAPGPSWSPAVNMRSLPVSIQSFLSDAHIGEHAPRHYQNRDLRRARGLTEGGARVHFVASGSEGEGTRVLHRQLRQVRGRGQGAGRLADSVVVTCGEGQLRAASPATSGHQEECRREKGNGQWTAD